MNHCSENFCLFVRRKKTHFARVAQIICATRANDLREKMFSFALSAKMFVAFDDVLLRDKLEFFLREVSFIIFSSANFLSLQR